LHKQKQQQQQQQMPLSQMPLSQMPLSQMPLSQMQHWFHVSPYHHMLLAHLETKCKCILVCTSQKYHASSSKSVQFSNPLLAY